MVTLMMRAGFGIDQAFWHARFVTVPAYAGAAKTGLAVQGF